MYIFFNGLRGYLSQGLISQGIIVLGDGGFQGVIVLIRLHASKIQSFLFTFWIIFWKKGIYISHFPYTIA